jgi:hypothetical protein
MQKCHIWVINVNESLPYGLEEDIFVVHGVCDRKSSSYLIYLSIYLI